MIIIALLCGCAEANQNDVITSQSATNQKITFTAPKPDREQINKFITPREAYDLIQANHNNPYFVVIDDRSSGDFSSGHIAKAVNIPASGFTSGVSNMDKNKIYVTYCRTGCGAASSKMKSLGFKEVYEIQGGLDAWQAARLPIEK